MDIYITEKATGFRVALSMLPESIKMNSGAKVQSYDILNAGEIRVPRGIKLLTVSWSATFPGAGRKQYSFIKRQHWRAPKELVGIFERWRKNGTRLILLVTETAINYEVFLTDLSTTNAGGAGDVQYDVAFCEYRELKVYTTSELNIKPDVKKTVTVRPAPAVKQKKTYTVKKGDCLWNIAQRYLGRGSRYTEIYNLNRDKIKNANLIYAGQVLTMP